MICRFNPKLHCFEINNNCGICSYGKNRTLDNVNRKIVLDMYRCPYCLHEDILEHFFSYNKDRKIYKLRKCPSCENMINQYTLDLHRSFDAMKYIQWIIEYPFYDFWKKVKFNIFIKNLNNINDSQIFFNIYRKEKTLRRP